MTENAPMRPWCPLSVAASRWLAMIAPSSSVAAGQQQSEFVAAEPVRAIRPPEVRPHDLGDGPEQLVARRMTLAIVDLLEVVDIDDQQGQWRLVVPGGRHLGVELLLERPMVAEAGQAVTQRIEPSPVVGLAQIRPLRLEDRRVATDARRREGESAEDEDCDRRRDRADDDGRIHARLPRVEDTEGEGDRCPDGDPGKQDIRSDGGGREAADGARRRS